MTDNSHAQPVALICATWTPLAAPAKTPVAPGSRLGWREDALSVALSSVMTAMNSHPPGAPLQRAIQVAVYAPAVVKWNLASVVPLPVAPRASGAPITESVVGSFAAGSAEDEGEPVPPQAQSRRTQTAQTISRLWPIGDRMIRESSQSQQSLTPRRASVRLFAATRIGKEGIRTGFPEPVDARKPLHLEPPGQAPAHA